MILTLKGYKMYFGCKFNAAGLSPARNFI
jgi:hypothetical protein